MATSVVGGSRAFLVLQDEGRFPAGHGEGARACPRASSSSTPRPSARTETTSPLCSPARIVTSRRSAAGPVGGGVDDEHVVGAVGEHRRHRRCAASARDSGR